MRIGKNPDNHKIFKLTQTHHRVIIPVYIPNSEGYFKDSLNVLKVCIESLLLTINQDTAVTLISNASSNEVNNYLKELWTKGKIDKVVFNKENVGKMNAVLSETRASFEKYITYSDSDVFFDAGWLHQTFTIFQKFPKAGFVSMNPMPGSYGFASSAIIDNLLFLQKKLTKINSITTYSDLAHFHESVGRAENITQKLFSEKALVLSNGETKCYIGAGHFCCTINKEAILKYIPTEKSNMSGSEKTYLDEPSEKSGCWRVSSTKAYVWHMGNILEPDWVALKMNELKEFDEKNFSFDLLNSTSKIYFSKILPYQIKIRVVGFLKKINIIK